MTHPIAKHLYAIQAVTGEGFFKLWDDWLMLAVSAFCRDDPAYMAVMSRYGPRIPNKDHPADHFSCALGEFLRTCQADSAHGAPFPDTLGRIYEEEALTNHYAGQFFTPEPICTMMAAMIVEQTDEPITICDPACGSGRFLIATQPLAPNATFTGIDRDLTCVHMTALNMLVRNADAYIVHGNTLSMETFGGYITRRSVFGGEILPLTAAQSSTILASAVKAQAERQPSVNNVEHLPTPALQPELPVEQSGSAHPQPFKLDRKGQFGFDF